MNRLLSGNMRVVSSRSRGRRRHDQIAIQGLQPAADAKGVSIAATLERAAHALADGRRVQQIVWNVLHNAIKFTPKGGRVTVRVEEGNGHVRIVVQDTGVGISREFLPHVFERIPAGGLVHNARGARPRPWPIDRQASGGTAGRNPSRVQRQARAGRHIHPGLARRQHEEQSAGAAHPREPVGHASTGDARWGSLVLTFRLNGSRARASTASATPRHPNDDRGM